MIHHALPRSCAILRFSAKTFEADLPWGPRRSLGNDRDTSSITEHRPNVKPNITRIAVFVETLPRPGRAARSPRLGNITGTPFFRAIRRNWALFVQLTRTPFGRENRESSCGVPSAAGQGAQGLGVHDRFFLRYGHGQFKCYKVQLPPATRVFGAVRAGCPMQVQHARRARAVEQLSS